MKVELVDTMGSCLSVVNAARVSFDKFSYELDEKDERLLTYLAEHDHWSPFAHTSLQFRIKAPIFVARQLGKHQVGLSWNEVSRRYVDGDPEFYNPTTWRGKPANDNKQGSVGEIEDQDTAKMILEQTNLLAFKNYKTLLAKGVAPEMARMILPQTMMTEWFWTGSLHAFARICKQRLDQHTQAETRVIAADIDKHCASSFPHSWRALMSA
jgi:thymidylate synthase (FAD)